MEQSAAGKCRPVIPVPKLREQMVSNTMQAAMQ